MVALRWGIVSSGRICHDFVCAVQTFSETEHQVIAIAARSQESADKFAREHGIPRSYEGYHKLATDPDLDIIYVGNLNPQHYEVSKLMLENGKNVLCEKPLTMNEKQTTELVELARKNKLFFMEAIWSRCFPVYRDVQKFIETGVIGEVRFVNINFGHNLNHVERLKRKEMGGGAILDLGVYILQFQQLFFRGLKPVKIVCNGHLNSEGTDDSAGAIITYPDGKMAVVSTSSIVKLPNEGIVSGTQGIIRIPDFWCPSKFYLNDRVYEYPLPKSDAEYFHHNSVGLVYEADEARMCIRDGSEQWLNLIHRKTHLTIVLLPKLALLPVHEACIVGKTIAKCKIESSCMPHHESIELAQLMDTMRKQVGVVFPEDEN